MPNSDKRDSEGLLSTMILRLGNESAEFDVVAAAAAAAMRERERDR